MKKLTKLCVCPKNSGNTFAVCEYVSKHTDSDLLCLNEREEFQLDAYDSIILCSGVYGGYPHAALTTWIENLEANRIGKNTNFYVFLTWFGRGNSDKTAMKKIAHSLEGLGLALEDDYASCYGKGMGIVRIGHPNTQDFEKILHWVESL